MEINRFEIVPEIENAIEDFIKRLQDNVHRKIIEGMVQAELEEFEKRLREVIAPIVKSIIIVKVVRGYDLYHERPDVSVTVREVSDDER